MLIISHEKPSVADLAYLYRDAGWIKEPEGLDLGRSIECTSQWIVAREGEEVVSVVRLQTDYVRYCCVYDLIVRSDRRGCGIGSRMMGEVLAFCDEVGVQMVHLWTTKGNAGFYERFGFKALDAERSMMIRVRTE